MKAARTLGKILVVYSAYFAVKYSTQEKPGTFADRKKARTQLETNGITSEQHSAYKLGMSDLLYKGVDPTYYPEDFTSVLAVVHDMPGNVFDGRKNLNNGTEENAPSEDAWAMYLGFPQKFNTFGISEYRPSHSKDDTYYYNIKDKQKAINLLENVAFSDNYAGPEERWYHRELQKIYRENGNTSDPLTIARTYMTDEEYTKFEEFFSENL